ncbi:autotransporter-associated beta strand repeat-containing protein [Rhodoblastus sp. 17X3]|uniref:autotransporter-associated beta strand repeat-containing protein n=1 Tax=Rhodoblastus sp. 17X3 TaxID=3047026 RepID=UPI0024B6F50A|nr:autotransporter-associated beta strand repeat-containing protein [Rhodoblastus sp. 17X3]MDI9849557.1 autotransporter-associated beta strand repeat-containing protein [Rhodoblastus sp. 17X3]
MHRRQIQSFVRRAAFAAAGVAVANFGPAAAQTLNLAGADLSVDTLSGFTSVTNNGRLPSVLTIGINGGSSTFAGTMADGLGSFGVVKVGAGVLTLTGTETQAGDTGFTYPGPVPIAASIGPITTAVTGGTLAINSGATLGGGTVAVSNAVLASTGGAPVTIVNQMLIGLAAKASATVDTSGGDIHIASTILGYQPPGSPLATDGGLIKTGAGSLYLESAAGNLFGGGIQIQQGTLVISVAQDLGAPSVATLASLAPGATLRSVADINGGFAGVFSLGCAAPGACGYANFAPDAGTTLTVNSDVTGAGGLRMSGLGTLYLDGAKTYTGGTLVSSGTLAINDATAAGAGSFGLENGARLLLMAGGLSITPTSFSLNGQGIIDTNGFNGSVGSAIVDGAATGSLVKDGAGTLALNAVATFSGPTEVRAGTLAMGVNNVLNPTTTVTVDSGAFLNLGGHALTLAAIEGVGTISGGGRVASQLIVGGTGASFAFDGVLTDGSGRLILTKQGAGTLALNGANSFSGGVNLLGGTIVVGSATALGSGPVSLDDGTTLAFSVASMTLANPIHFTGVTDPTIDTGAGAITLSNSISGASSLTKIGSGALILTGASTYTGATLVSQGLLEVDGSIVSPATVYAGATLRGVGAVGAIDVLAGGMLAPGNAAQPFGTLHATGNVFLAPGSIFSVTFSPAGSSLLTTTGSASVGGTVAALWSGGAPTIGSRYTILSAAGGVTGAFSGLTVAGLGSLLPVLAYDANDVYLAFNGLTRQAAQNSFQTQANDRFGALVTYQVLASVLDGFNEQINCTNCVSAFGSVGSLSGGVHGRYAINDDLALLGGAAIAQYHSGEVEVTSSPIFLAALRYDKTEWGASRPFAEIGAAASPWQNVSYRRGYFDGVAMRQGRGASNADSYDIFGKAGWVMRWSPVDESSVYGGLSRVWQNAGGFVESSVNNSSPATISPGMDAINVARFGAQWTHLFVPNLESQINLALAQSFGSQSGLRGSILGYGNIQTRGNDYTWAEYGLRVGYRVAQGLVADVFADGTLGAEPVGATIHGGVDLRYSF